MYESARAREVGGSECGVRCTDVVLSSHLRFLRKIVFLISLTANHHQDHDSRHPSRSGTPAGHSLGMDGCRVDIGQMGGDGGRTGIRSRCGTNWASHVGPARRLDATPAHLTQTLRNSEKLNTRFCVEFLGFGARPRGIQCDYLIEKATRKLRSM